MIRKLFVMAATVSIPLASVAAIGGIAGAKTVFVDATDYSVACTGIAGVAKFSPALHLTGSGTETTTVKATLSGCTATPTPGGTPLTITGATVKGTLTNVHGDGCAGLATDRAETGTLTTEWKTSVKLTSPSTVINVNSVSGGPTADSLHGLLTSPGSIPHGAVTGPFQGVNGGADDSTVSATVQTFTEITSSCASNKGLKSINLTNTDSGSTDAVSYGVIGGFIN